MKQFFLMLCLLTATSMMAQSNAELPYRELPDYPETFTAGTMAARLVDALGFRYYWATDGLEDDDLAYQTNDEVRSTGETVDHVLNLSFVIVKSTLKQPNAKNDTSLMTFDEKRQQTLLNLQIAADILRVSDDVSQFKILFGDREIPFWNNVNGPIADAIWHCGQIASLRRASGNPISTKVDHFNGNVRE